MLIPFSNFQLPVPSTFAVLLLMILCSESLISVMIAVPGVPVPVISKISPLYTMFLIPLIVILISLTCPTLFSLSPNLKLTIFSAP